MIRKRIAKVFAPQSGEIQIDPEIQNQPQP
jgi:hypothetical protein